MTKFVLNSKTFKIISYGFQGVEVNETIKFYLQNLMLDRDNVENSIGFEN